MTDTPTNPTVEEPQATTSPDPAEAAPLKDRVVEALREVFDPEIPVNIYDLGLIYDIDTSDDGSVEIKMTLTSPACPVAGSLPPEVAEKAKTVDDVTDAHVDVVWDPPWTPERMSDAAKLQLGLE